MLKSSNFTAVKRFYFLFYILIHRMLSLKRDILKEGLGDVRQIILFR